MPEEILTRSAALLGPELSVVAADAFLLNQAIETVRACLLVQRNPREQTLSIHRLVQAVLQDAVEENERHTWAQRALCAVENVFAEAEYAVWSQCERIVSHAIHVAESIEREQFSGPEPGRLLSKTARYLHQRARYAEAEAFYLQALQICERTQGKVQLDLARLLGGLATLYRQQGQYSDAEQLYQRALRIYEQSHSPEHPGLAQLLRNLSGLYKRQGRYAEARALCEEELRIRQGLEGNERSDLADLFQTLAGLSRHQGKYRKAEAYYRQALFICEQGQEADHLSVFSPLNGLAALSRQQANMLMRRCSPDKQCSFVSRRWDLIIPMSPLRCIRWQGSPAIWENMTKPRPAVSEHWPCEKSF